MYSKVVVPETDCKKYIAFRSHNAEDWRGPHQGIEMILFEKSNKQCALVTNWEFFNTENWAAYCKVRDYKISQVEEFGSFLVTKNNHEVYLNILKRAKKMYREGKINWRVYTIRLGRVLGYTKNQIEKFLEDVAISKAA